jgi:hypothetical protein
MKSKAPDKPVSYRLERQWDEEPAYFDAFLISLVLGFLIFVNGLALRVLFYQEAIGWRIFGLVSTIISLCFIVLFSGALYMCKGENPRWVAIPMEAKK